MIKSQKLLTLLLVVLFCFAAIHFLNEPGAASENQPPVLSVTRSEPVFDEADKFYTLDLNITVNDPDTNESITGRVRAVHTKYKGSFTPSTVIHFPGTGSERTVTNSVILEMPGTYNLEVTVKDSHGAKARWRDEVIIIKKNRAPELSVTMSKPVFDEVEKYFSVNLIINVKDPDDNEMITGTIRMAPAKFEVSHAPAVLIHFTGTKNERTVTQSVILNMPGTYNVEVIVNDSHGAADRWNDTFNIGIEETNRVEDNESAGDDEGRADEGDRKERVEIPDVVALDIDEGKRMLLSEGFKVTLQEKADCEEDLIGLISDVTAPTMRDDFTVEADDMITLHYCAAGEDAPGMDAETDSIPQTGEVREQEGNDVPGQQDEGTDNESD